LSATTEDIISDWWAHYYTDNAGKDEVEDDDFSLEDALENARRRAEEPKPYGDWEDVEL
jgi:hypothetical protein